jgi:L-seryl-tRNA(Ser) seleniumtransferase
MAENPFRRLPAVTDVLTALAAQSASAFPHERLVEAVRAELASLRTRLAQGDSLDGETDAQAVAARAVLRLQREERPRLRSVINATGIILHTNLGRAPTAPEAAQAAHDAAAGYLNLELDLETGKRSSRQDAIREWVRRLTGAESATAVNNNAAATVIVLRAVAAGREVIVSRGQLIEIGGSFRIPDIMAVSGAVLREVGTTNITRRADYERAIGPNTAALLRVHSSNYRISGFTEAVDLSDLVSLGRAHNLPVIDDVGSGALVDFARFAFRDEPLARDSIAAGADLVLFSGDKLMGGPQAGIIAGRKEWIQKIEKDPLMRAFRLDKMTLAALEATLRLYIDEERALLEIPVLRMLATPLDELRRRAEALVEQLRGAPGVASVEMKEDVAFVGGGSLPDQATPTWVVEIEPAGVSDDELARRLRVGTPAVMGRLRSGRLVLDVRTVFPEDEPGLLAAVRAACQSSSEEPVDPRMQDGT